MKNNTLLILLMLCALNSSYAQSKLVLDKNTTPKYNELIEAYQQLDKQYSNAKLLTYGMSDFGLALQLLVISESQVFNPKEAKQKSKAILMINNGIHPGEPCGVNASLMLAQDILSGSSLNSCTLSTSALAAS